MKQPFTYCVYNLKTVVLVTVTFISFLLSGTIQILLPADRTSYESNRDERNL